jgi:hypothetical protein
MRDNNSYHDAQLGRVVSEQLLLLCDDYSVLIHQEALLYRIT